MSAPIEPPANVTPYVDVLGVDLAQALFLALGGSQIYLPKKSGDETLAAKTIGANNVERLAAEFGYGYIKVPLAREWIARVMRSRNASDNEIARAVRCDVSTVRRWLGPKHAEQLNLF